MIYKLICNNFIIIKKKGKKKGKIPTRISLISPCIVIRALSADDKRLIPFVERVAQGTVVIGKKVVTQSC
jgi:hypothetical protein